MFKRYFLVSLFALSIVFVQAFGQEQEDAGLIQICENSAVCFVEGETAKALIAKTDEYIEALSPMDCKIRCNKEEGATKEAYIALLQTQVLPWGEQDKALVKRAAEIWYEPLSALGPNLPSVISLIKVKDGIYKGLAYTRMDFIVLTEGMLRFRNFFISRLFPHELFHVYSRMNPNVSDKLYRLIGFENRGPLQLTEELAARRLTNPDYPKDLYSIEVEYLVKDVNPHPGLSPGEKIMVFPCIFAPNSTFLAPEREELSFVDYYMEGFCLLVVEIRGSPVKKDHYFVPRLEDGKPILLRPESTNFHEFVRANTGYVHGPEEIMAENFVCLLWMHYENLPLSHPGVVEEMATVLMEHAVSK